MSKIIAIEHLSLDGVYQGPARPNEDTRDGFAHGGWASAGNAPEMQQVIGEAMGGPWSLLTGRITYEDLYGFWPNQPPNPMTDALNKVTKFVVSRSSAHLPWSNSVLLEGEATDTVAQLKKEHDKTLIIFGSGELVQALKEYNLVDEFVLMIHPVVLGEGRRFFTGDRRYARLKLQTSLTTAGGVLITRYQYA